MAAGKFDANAQAFEKSWIFPLKALASWINPTYSLLIAEEN
jgi:hypothetical protein